MQLREESACRYEGSLVCFSGMPVLQDGGSSPCHVGLLLQLLCHCAAHRALHVGPDLLKLFANVGDTDQLELTWHEPSLRNDHSKFRTKVVIIEFQGLDGASCRTAVHSTRWRTQMSRIKGTVGIDIHTGQCHSGCLCARLCLPLPCMP